MKSGTKLDSSKGKARYRAVLKHIVWSPARAALDAARAWIITPVFFARCAVKQKENGGLRLIWRRPFSMRERLEIKIGSAGLVFWHSLRLRLARTVCIPRLGSEGLMANLLHVLEVLHRVRPDADVHVDWVLNSSDQGFRYGQVGENVWTGLFRTLDEQPHRHYFRAIRQMDLAFWGMGKDYLKGRALQRHRDVYNRTLGNWVEIINTRVLEEVRSAYERSLNGRFSIGIHRRVGNPLVSLLQRDGAVPTIERFIECVRAQVRSCAATDWVVFLATDDADSAPLLRQAFGQRLVVRGQVRRTTADEAEVHSSAWGKLSMADAEDVLIDTLLLARCDVLLHASSSISTMAGLLNPALCLVRVAGVG